MEAPSSIDDGSSLAAMAIPAWQPDALTAIHWARDEGYWTGLFALPVLPVPADRACSQLVMENLVAAVTFADLVSPDVVHTLRSDADRAPPIEPFGKPYVAASWRGGLLFIRGLEVRAPRRMPLDWLHRVLSSRGLRANGGGAE